MGPLFTLCWSNRRLKSNLDVAGDDDWAFWRITGGFCMSELQLCLFPDDRFSSDLAEPYGVGLSPSSLMFSLFFDLCMAANNSSFDIVLLVGDRTRFVGVLLPELDVGEGQFGLPISAMRSAIVGIVRPIGVDVAKLFSWLCLAWEIGLWCKVSALEVFVTGSRTGEDPKNRYPCAVSPSGAANLFLTSTIAGCCRIAIGLLGSRLSKCFPCRSTCDSNWPCIAYMCIALKEP